MHGDAAQDCVTAAAVPSAGVAVTEYDVIAEPPLYEGVVHDTVAAPSVVVDGVAVTFVGAAGTMVVPHLRARYSSIVRCSAVVTVPVKTIVSGSGPAHQ